MSDADGGIKLSGNKVTLLINVQATTFTPEKVTTILDDMVKTMEPEMARHIKRWGIPSSMSAWKSSVSDLRGCLQKRTDYALSYLQKEFGFSNAQMEQWKANATAKPVAAAAE